MVPLDLLLENNIFSRTNDLLLDLQCSEEGAIKEYWGFPAICLQTEPKGQLISEQIYAVLNFPKMQRNIARISALAPEIYIQSAPNNSNEAYTFMCLGREGRFGQC